MEHYSGSAVRHLDSTICMRKIIACLQETHHPSHESNFCAGNFQEKSTGKGILNCRSTST